VVFTALIFLSFLSTTKHDAFPEEDEARLFWRQIVIAVKYMHSRNIAHRDLKVRLTNVYASACVPKRMLTVS